MSDRSIGIQRITVGVSESQNRSSLANKRALLTDAVLDVGLGIGNGMYVWGRPGTGKTHTVKAALASKQIPYHYQQGHANPLPLFNSIQEYPEGIHVLDDTTEIIKNPRGLEILKAALGADQNGRRIVTYQMGQQKMMVNFTGGLIAISNQEKISPALQSRIAYYHFDLSDEEMDEAFEELANQPWQHRQGSLTVEECHECLKEVRNIKVELEIEGRALRLDLRTLTHHAYPFYLSGKLGHATVNWRDRLRAAMEQEFSGIIKCKTEEMADDRELIRKIIGQHSTKEDQIKAWMKLSGKSRASFFRRQKELKAATMRH